MIYFSYQATSQVRVLNAAAGTVERVVDCGSAVDSLSYDPNAEATLAGCDDGKVRVKAALYENLIDIFALY